MGKHKKHKRTKKPTEPPPLPTDDPAQRIPKSFVMRRGRIGATLKELIMDMRRVMKPYTAVKLRERPSNTLKDFVHVSSLFGITHYLIFSSTDLASYLRLVRVPHGPTLHFRVHAYTLVRDLVTLQRHPHSPGSEFNTSPMLIMNNFGGSERHIKLMVTAFQNLFPAINLQTVKLSDIRRVIVLDYDKETQHIEFRHYLIQVSPVGLNKGIKRLVQTRIPKLSEYHDISDYVLHNTGATESDVEDTEDNKLVLPDDYVGKKTKNKQTAIRLHELGPRMTLQLIKIEAGLCEGEVLYHHFARKSGYSDADVRNSDAKLEDMTGGNDNSSSEEEVNDTKAGDGEVTVQEEGEGRRPSVHEPNRLKRRKNSLPEDRSPKRHKAEP